MGAADGSFPVARRGRKGSGYRCRRGEVTFTSGGGMCELLPAEIDKSATCSLNQTVGSGIFGSGLPKLYKGRC
jgi:hypothetical protein